MKIVCISTLTPSRQGLNEYLGLLLAHSSSLESHSFVVMADKLSENKAEVLFAPNLRIERVWTYNKAKSFMKLIRGVRREKPDIVWFNLILSSFGDRPSTAFIMLLLPLILRLMGFKVVVTLHHMIEFMDVGDSKFKGKEKIIRVMAMISQWLLSLAGPLVLLLDKYISYVSETYPFANPVRLHHGFPLLEIQSIKPKDRFDILVFGKFGSYKKLDFAIECLRLVRKLHPEVTMSIAGSSHPSYPNYYQDFQRIHQGEEGLTFYGYIPDEKMAQLFTNASLVFLPYSSSTGVSGVAHLAAGYGLAVVAPNLADFIAMEREEEIGICFFENQRLESAVNALANLVSDRAALAELSRKSCEGAKKRSFDKILKDYVDVFSEYIARGRA